MTGTPPIVLAEKIESDKSSFTSNNLPRSPSTENIVDPDPSTAKVLPSKVRLASALIVVELTEVNTLLSAGLV
jgi:hypothetical protein